MSDYSTSRESLLRWHEGHNIPGQDCPHCEIDKLRELLVGLYSESYIESVLGNSPAENRTHIE